MLQVNLGDRLSNLSGTAVQLTFPLNRLKKLIEMYSHKLRYLEIKYLAAE